MNHDRVGADDDIKTEFSNLEAQVGVLVVGRGEPGIEPAESVPDRAANEQRRARAVVDHSTEPVLRLVGRLAVAVLPAAAVGPDDDTGFLKQQIISDDHRTDGPGARVLVEFVDERVDPTGDHPCVVVEQHDVLALSGLNTGGAGSSESRVVRQVDDAQPTDRIECRSVLDGRRVVDEDDLDRRGVAGEFDRLEASNDVLKVVERGDDDAHSRGVARWQRDPARPGCPVDTETRRNGITESDR